MICERSLARRSAETAIELMNIEQPWSNKRVVLKFLGPASCVRKDQNVVLESTYGWVLASGWLSWVWKWTLFSDVRMRMNAGTAIGELVIPEDRKPQPAGMLWQ